MMALMGKLGISIAYQVVFLYACELFPTEVRVRGLGTSTILAKAGAMVAPFILEILVGRRSSTCLSFPLRRIVLLNLNRCVES